jgi:hypothetical protein
MLPYIVTVHHPICGTDVIRVTSTAPILAAERAEWLAYERHGEQFTLDSFFAAKVDVDTQSCIS